MQEELIVGEGGLTGISHFSPCGRWEEARFPSSGDSSIPFERQGRDRVRPARGTHVWTVTASVPVQGGGLSGWGTDSVIGMHTAPCQMMPLIVLR